MNSKMTNYNDLIQEYAPDNSIFSEDDAYMNKLKNIIFNELPEVDRRVLLIYSECSSMEETGRILHVSASTIYKRISKIRDKIKNGLYVD